VNRLASSWQEPAVEVIRARSVRRLLVALVLLLAIGLLVFAGSDKPILIGASRNN